MQLGKIVSNDIVDCIRTRPNYVGGLLSYYSVRNIRIFEDFEYCKYFQVDTNPANSVTLSVFADLYTRAFLPIAQTDADNTMPLTCESEKDFPQPAIALVD